MPLDNCLFNAEDTPFLIARDDVVVDTGYAFYALTGYTRAELVNRKVREVYSELLRATSSSADFRIKTDDIIFTRNLMPIEVKMTAFRGKAPGETVYILEEKPNSRLDDKFIFLEQMFAENVVGIAVYSVPGLILLKANQRYLDFLDAPHNKAENSIGRPIGEIVTGFKGSQSDVNFSKVLATRSVIYNKEYRYDKYERGVTFWDSTISPVFENNSMKYIIENATDVTCRVRNRRRLEEQARLIEQKNRELEAVFENMSDALFILDRDYRPIIANAEARRYFSEVDGSLSLIGASSRSCYLDMSGNPIPPEMLPVERVIRGERLRNERMALNNGETAIIVEVNASQVCDENGNAELVIVGIRDVTSIVEVERLIQQQKERLEAIIESMSDGLYTVGRNGSITAYNQNGMEFLDAAGKATTQESFLKNCTVYDIDGKALTFEELPGTRVLSGEKIKFERLMVRYREGDRKYMLSGSPVYDKDGLIEFAVICTRDVTDMLQQEKTAEENQRRLIKAEREKNAALKRAIEVKDEFLSLVSHEFKTPLAVINSAVQAMELICRDELSDKSRGFLSKIRQNSYRQLRLVNNLLDITRINAGRIKICKRNIDIVFVTKAITESVILYSQQKDIIFEFYSSFPARVIGLDEEKYERILLNLLSNAIKFSPRCSTIAVRLSKRGGFIALEVKDSGVGIPRDKKQMIFEKFGQVDTSLTRQAEGTGIGLSLAKMFVEALGGTISVTSRVGRGSTFTVMLPDELAIEQREEKIMQEMSDNRLVNSIAIEFSDIYLS